MMFLALTGFAATARHAWVFESSGYADAVRAAQTTGWVVDWCGSKGVCGAEGAAGVEVVIGRADAASDLSSLPNLKLAQSPSYFNTDGDRVPLQAAITRFSDWPAYGNEEIAEFVIAAIFQHVYRLAERGEEMRRCAWAADASAACSAATTATNHSMVSDLVIGVVGYGHIGQAVARRAGALGATVVATALNVSRPAPPPLAWLSTDNDRLYHAADVVVVTVPGSVLGLINATSLGLMKDDALIIPVSAGPLNFADLAAALAARPSLSAVIDVWPGGCFHFPNVTCGAPLGAPNWPTADAAYASLPNVLPLPGMAMRDARFWAASAKCVAANLDALATGQPLSGVVRNGTGAGLQYHDV